MNVRVYLDHAASTPLDPRVLEAQSPFFSAANPSGIHQSGQQAAAALTQARQNIAKLLAVKPQELVFTSGGTEANNLAVWGLAKPGSHMLVSPVEHPSVLLPLERMSVKFGVELEVLPVNGQGLVDPVVLKSRIRLNTALVAIQWANNETGAVQPVTELAKVTQKAQVPLFCDAAQASPSLDLNPAQLGVDLMSLSAHKLHGPKGVGLLYVNERLKLEPLVLGGGQERGLRSGTENLPGIWGFAQALALAYQERTKRVQNFLALTQTLDLALEGLGQPVLEPQTPVLPQIRSYLFPGFLAQRLLMRLDLEGFEVGSGSACSVGNDEPSPVLLAMGLDPALARSVLRFSFGADSRPESLDRLREVMTRILRQP
ncbi:MAG: hypothetical protein A2600_03840 [Candidatus Lambdaproteobacteria bacterium RIFOXYD1_FULL_56_27]|uniref:cysteine desulfurase n=1 Tax=Candidatus Lambdaproteobacteria bacterium RIFOXYD2_FULL_56_26 TaxID=1817773 RepID=A0A1F6H3E6_9PROT|nr:MAG: hypothetical protein A2426_11250 [Candidatus Lambdaproteobacteria bacterium RIFOXYC1_FULL_56_13]OGH04893.1 MAG: hypothetical protein A2557_07905 [Candidatus Lambdaproteobacteria bacterium RIFOXYD2_FULL_56_26]OGH09358.1 MAG: hypothetical protein A2600_03840 [Candidatus Lambdaproteobacteria bacterium RIFOXYD1_FULL_56_27]